MFFFSFWDLVILDVVPPQLLVAALPLHQYLINISHFLRAGVTRPLFCVSTSYISGPYTTKWDQHTQGIFLLLGLMYFK